MKRARVEESAEAPPKDHVTTTSNDRKIPSVRVSKTVKACEYPYLSIIDEHSHLLTVLPRYRVSISKDQMRFGSEWFFSVYEM